MYSHNMQISHDRYLNKVFQNSQKQFGNNENSPQFAIEAIKTNVLVMKAAIRLGPNYNEKWEEYKNTYFEEIQILFGHTQRLISEHSEEIFNVKPVESAAPSCTRSTLSHDQVIKWTKNNSRCLLRLCSMPGEDV